MEAEFHQAGEQRLDSVARIAEDLRGFGGGFPKN